MRIPIFLDGAEAGRLFLRREGPWTEIDARMPDPGRVLRLTLYGEGEFYLGVPVPEGDGLRLYRRLTAAEAKALPEHPAYAAEHPIAPPEPAAPRHVLWMGGRAYYF